MVARWETGLAQGGLWALAAAALLRHFLPLLLWRAPWLLDTQLILALLLAAACLLAGSLAGGVGGRALNAALGAACWATALSLGPKYLWPLPGGRPDWQLWLALGLWGGAALLRSGLLRRWSLELTGLGWEAVEAWATARPLYARSLAARRLRLLGWREKR